MIENTRIQIIDKPNLNGRIYSKAVIEKAIENKDFVYGYIGMPYPDRLKLEDISHQVTNLRIEEQWVGDGSYDYAEYLVGDILVLNTPVGSVLKKLMSNNIRFDFRISGYGYCDGDGIISDLKIISINAVDNGA